ncbi:MAG: hypothetical protein ACXWTT_11540 [Methylobacter sp.]
MAIETDNDWLQSTQADDMDAKYETGMAIKLIMTGLTSIRWVTFCHKPFSIVRVGRSEFETA